MWSFGFDSRRRCYLGLFFQGDLVAVAGGFLISSDYFDSLRSGKLDHLMESRGNRSHLVDPCSAKDHVVRGLAINDKEPGEEADSFGVDGKENFPGGLFDFSTEPYQGGCFPYQGTFFQFKTLISCLEDDVAGAAAVYQYSFIRQFATGSEMTRAS